MSENASQDANDAVDNAIKTVQNKNKVAVTRQTVSDDDDKEPSESTTDLTSLDDLSSVTDDEGDLTLDADTKVTVHQLINFAGSITKNDNKLIVEDEVVNLTGSPGDLSDADSVTAVVQSDDTDLTDDTLVGAVDTLDLNSQTATLSLTQAELEIVNDDGGTYSIEDTVQHLTGDQGDLSGAESVTVQLASDGTDADLSDDTLDDDVDTIDLNSQTATLSLAQAGLTINDSGSGGTYSIVDTVGNLTGDQGDLSGAKSVTAQVESSGTTDLTAETLDDDVDTLDVSPVSAGESVRVDLSAEAFGETGTSANDLTLKARDGDADVFHVFADSEGDTVDISGVSLDNSNQFDDPNDRIRVFGDNGDETINLFDGTGPTSVQAWLGQGADDVDLGTDNDLGFTSALPGTGSAANADDTVFYGSYDVNGDGTDDIDSDPDTTDDFDFGPDNTGFSQSNIGTGVDKIDNYNIGQDVFGFLEQNDAGFGPTGAGLISDDGSGTVATGNISAGDGLIEISLSQEDGTTNSEGDFVASGTSSSTLSDADDLLDPDKVLDEIKAANGGDANVVGGSGNIDLSGQDPEDQEAVFVVNFIADSTGDAGTQAAAAFEWDDNFDAGSASDNDDGKVQADELSLLGVASNGTVEETFDNIS